MIIPDQSLKTVFDTCLYFDIPLGVQGESKVSLATGAVNVSASYVQINWASNSLTGQITQTETATPTQLETYRNGANDYYAYLPASTTPVGYKVLWQWEIDNGVKEQYQLGYVARDYMPHYLQILPPFQNLCQTVLNTWTFLHDNSYGNSRPAESEMLQVHFSLDDVAEAMQTALMVFQASVSVPTYYTLTSSATFPYKEYGGILYTATLRELTHRVMIGYIETPSNTGSTDIGYIDRKDYYNKWKEEYDRLDKQMQTLQTIYQRRHIDYSGGVALVSGGFYGASGPLLTNQQINAMYQGQYVNSFFPLPLMYNPNGGSNL